MSRITLTIKPDYCPTWNWFEGVRELLQNAKDADEFGGHTMEVEHSAKAEKLTITSKGVGISPADLLLLGATTKSAGNQRGRFGEGFVIGVLALIRAGFPVTIYNGGEVWRPAIEEADEGTFSGQKILVMKTRILQKPREDFTIEIENVTKDIWDATRPLFLFLQPPEKTLAVNRGRVLFDEWMVGKIFSRGIFITNIKDLKVGYDLEDLTLDRDRRMVNEWDLQWRLGALWSEAANREPEKMAIKVYEMAKEDAYDTKSLRHSADSRLIAKVRQLFQEEHGEDAVPVTSLNESKEVSDLGLPAALVNTTMRELLTMGGLNLEERKQKSRGKIIHQYTWAELTEKEQQLIEKLSKVSKNFFVVKFADDSIDAVLETTDDTRLNISRTLLSQELPIVVEKIGRQEIIRAAADPVEYFSKVVAEVLG